jgi:tetratricopeptide (TPR) repeat protein
MSAVAGVVAAAEERLRGGPFVDQDQVQTQARTANPCSDEARLEANDLFAKARGLKMQKRWREALDALNKAQELCPHYNHMAMLGEIFYDEGLYTAALPFYAAVVAQTDSSSVIDGMPQGRTTVQNKIARISEYITLWGNGEALLAAARFDEAVQAFQSAYEQIPNPRCLFFVGKALHAQFDQSGDMAQGNAALPWLRRFIEEEEERFPAGYRSDQYLADARAHIRDIENWRTTDAAIRQQAAAQSQQQQQQAQAAAPTGRAQTEQAQVSTEEARRQRRQEAQQAQTGEAQAAGAAQQTTSTGAQAGGAKPPGTADAGTKPPTGQTQGTNIAGGPAQQGITATQGGKPPDTTGGTKPPSGQAPAAKNQPQAPGTKPAAAAPEAKPIVSVQVGYSFKRIKMSGHYEVDMRKRLREDRDIVMSGNIGGVFQKYGEDRRFFSVVSLDDPTFQERAVEVILDGQDAADFKSYINAVSVLFRKQRFSGAPMTGEVKFVDQQFAQSGNRQSFKYGRLNEASTEWLDYEYKPKWSLYGGVEWEGEWTKTSDSVLTLAPPVRRRSIEISVDEDNILKNNVKALAVQIKHTVFGKDILKEVVINYDKGDPLQAGYTYMHEDGSLGYSYKVVWLFLDGREVHTDWMAKESPFILAVFTKK